MSPAPTPPAQGEVTDALRSWAITYEFYADCPREFVSLISHESLCRALQEGARLVLALSAAQGQGFCSYCHGMGSVPVSDEHVGCTHCQGTGMSQPQGERLSDADVAEIRRRGDVLAAGGKLTIALPESGLCINCGKPRCDGHDGDSWERCAKRYRAWSLMNERRTCEVLERNGIDPVTLALRAQPHDDAAGRECAWTREDGPDGDGIWHTTCGQAHEFTCDGPNENSHRFCPYCGAALVAAKANARGEG